MSLNVPRGRTNGCAPIPSSNGQRTGGSPHAMSALGPPTDCPSFFTVCFLIHGFPCEKLPARYLTFS